MIESLALQFSVRSGVWHQVVLCSASSRCADGFQVLSRYSWSSAKRSSRHAIPTCLEDVFQNDLQVLFFALSWWACTGFNEEECFAPPPPGHCKTSAPNCACQNRAIFLWKIKTFEFRAMFLFVFLESKTFKLLLQTMNIYLEYEFWIEFQLTAPY